MTLMKRASIPVLLNQYGGPLERVRPTKTSHMRNAYEAAGNTHKNIHYWKDARGQSFEGALHSDKAIIINRIQHEIRNNPFLKGIARKYANFLVGEGPIPTIICKDNEDWATEAETRFKKWSNNSNFLAPESLNPNIRSGSLANMLRLGTKGFFDYGEYLMIPQTDNNAAGINKLKLKLINPRRLRTPFTFGAKNGNRIVNGVEIDANDKPVKYWFSKDIERDTFFSTNLLSATTEEFTSIDARLVIHDFEKDDPDQFRGVPWHAQSINVSGSVRHFKESTLSTAEMQSLVATILTCDNPELIGETAMELLNKYGPEQFIEDIIPGTMNTMPVGYKVDHTNPTHPNTQYKEFVNQNYGEISSGSCDMPFSIAGSDTSSSNFASGKIDVQHFGKNLEATRFTMEENTLNKAFDLWLMEEMLISEADGGLPDPGCDFTLSWIWKQQAVFLDEQKKANARATNLKNSVEVLPDIWQEDHKDPDEMWEKIEAQNKRMRDLDLSFDIVSVNETISIEGDLENG